MAHKSIPALLLAVAPVWAQPASGRMMGVVTDATTRLPLQYAWVKATDATGEGMAGVTDENGNFTIDDLPTGDSDGPGGAEKLPGNPPMAGIKGKVNDQKSGEPLFGRNVVLRRAGEPAGGERTAATGDFEIPGLEPGDYTLEIDSSREPRIFSEPFREVVPAKWYGSARYPPTIHVEEGERRFVDVRLSEVRAYSVKVQLPAGYESAKCRSGMTGNKVACRISANCGRGRFALKVCFQGSIRCWFLRAPNRTGLMAARP